MIDRLMNAATLLVLVLTLGVGVRVLMLFGAKSPPAVLKQGERITSVSLGDSGAAMRKVPAATPIAIYVFSTTCPICTEQKTRIAALLAKMPSERVITTSLESSEKTSAYWQGALPSPTRLRSEGSAALKVVGYPYLLVISREGKVLFSQLGKTEVTSDELARLLTSS
ncbi:MAG: hypothetical protein ABI625_12860 [bacterium]